MQWLERHDAWDGTLPAVLIGTARDTAGRRALLAQFAAMALGRAPRDIAILHREGAAPRFMRPEGTRLHLSSASRGEAVALAIADRPIGIDLELVDPGAEIPWNVLHPDERRFLEATPEAERALHFAAIWSAKEAYLKARGTGLFREPASFAARFASDGGLRIDDPEAPGRFTRAETIRQSLSGQSLVVSAVILSRA